MQHGQTIYTAWKIYVKKNTTLKSIWLDIQPLNRVIASFIMGSQQSVTSLREEPLPWNDNSWV